MEDVGPALGLMAILAFVAFRIWIREQSRQERRRQNLAEREKLFERIGTGDALTAFLQSEEGKRLLAGINEPDGPDRSAGMRASFLGLLTAGVIATAMAGGFMYIAPLTQPELRIPGAIIGSIGLGCIAAGMLHYAFGKAWGTYHPRDENGRVQRSLD